VLPKSGRYASDNLTEATAPHGVQFHVRLPPKEPSPMFVRWLLNGIVILISIAALWVIGIWALGGIVLAVRGFSWDARRE